MGKTRESRFSLLLTVGLALAVVVGVVYGLVTLTNRVAAQADSLYAADEALLSVTVTRAQIETVALQSGALTDPERGAALAAGIAEARTALLTVEGARTDLAAAGESSAGFDASVVALRNSADDALAGLEAGSVPALETVRSDYDAAVGELVTIRDNLDSALGAARGLTGLASVLTAFLVVLVIPGVVIWAYSRFNERLRRQHEIDLSSATERAAQSSREEFLNIVSHQLRKPLTGVRAIANLMAEDDSLMGDALIADLHSLLVGETDDMTGLIDDLMTASRLQSGSLEYSMEPVDVRDETAAMLMDMSHRGASIYTAMDEGTVRVDRRRLRQIVRNLLSNAMKYGGPNVEVEGRADEKSYVLTVVDDGAGVPDALRHQLFARFAHDGAPRTSNMGLGLSMVMALAVGMGGTAFYARDDGLTRFGVVLPVTSEEPATRIGSYEPPEMARVIRAVG